MLVGAGKSTSSVNAYFPSTVRIRTGDTVTWNMNSDGDPHTVTFNKPQDQFDIISVPGGGPKALMVNPKLVWPTRGPSDPIETFDPSAYVNSGIFFPEPPGLDIPIVDTFSLTFDTPGTYEYVCGIHSFHKGTVVVEPPTATHVPGQAEIDALAQREMAPKLQMTDWIQGLVASGTVLDEEPGPDGNTVWLVSAAMGPPDAEVLEFVPKNLTVQEGDTVVWTSAQFHAVVFSPNQPFPRFYIPLVIPNAPPLITIHPNVVFPVRPSGEYDGTEYYSSGLIGYGARSEGVGFSLTFTKAGRHRYMCPIHAGMIGTITVEGG